MLPYSHTHTHTLPHAAAQRTRRKSQNASAAFRGAFSRLLKSFAQRQESASNNNNNKNNDKGKEGEKIVFYYDDICCFFSLSLFSLSLILPVLPYILRILCVDGGRQGKRIANRTKWQVASGKLRTARGLTLKFASGMKTDLNLAYKVDLKFAEYFRNNAEFFKV